MTTTLLIVMCGAAVAWGAVLAVKRGRDSKRLNWMERTRSEIDTDGPGFVIYNSTEELGGGASGGSYKRLRNAIDAAMRKHG